MGTALQRADAGRASAPIIRAFRKAFFAAWLFRQQRQKAFREPHHHKFLRIPLDELYYIGDLRKAMTREGGAEGSG